MSLKSIRVLRSTLSSFHVQRYTYSGETARTIQGGPTLEHFIKRSANHCDEPQLAEKQEVVPYLSPDDLKAKGRKVYMETYGCQMNVNDTEIAWSILKDAGYQKSSDIGDADVILAVTCAIRENAEAKIWNRLDVFKSLKRRRSRQLPPLKVGVLGCMAERLKKQLLETDKGVDLVAGPDSYRDLPRMLALTESGQSAVNVLLSLDETYGDIMPVRLDTDSPSAFVSIMRGCENMCSFCIVPFTRGQERSRPVQSILEEIRMLSDQGVKEVTLLGQNVNSYRDTSEITLSREETRLSRGFKTIYQNKEGGLRFTYLLDRVSRINPEMRIRFTSPHPKDFPDELLHLIQERHNICKSVHLPAQSGSTEVLQRMRRGHTREAYLELVENTRRIISGVTLSSDFITGFCGETPEEHQDTVSLMKQVQYDMAYMFAYSMRKKTHAYHQMKDDVPEEVKQMRLREIIDLFYSTAAVTNKRFIGSHQVVLVEKVSKRNEEDMVGRNDGNIKTIVTGGSNKFNKGDYVLVKITDVTSTTLIGQPVRTCLLVDENYKNQSLQSSAG